MYMELVVEVIPTGMRTVLEETSHMDRVRHTALNNGTTEIVAVVIIAEDAEWATG